ncbi:MAG: TolC family protein [Bacteroidota bacterium]
MKLRFYGFLFLIFSAFISTAQEVSLEQAVQLGLQKNFDVQVLQKTGEVAFNDNRFAYGAFLPTLNATGSYIQNTNNSKNVNFAGTEKIVPTAQSTNTNAAVQLVWTLFDGTRMFATRRRLEELATLGEINVRNQMMNSAASIISTYFNIIRQKQQLKAIQELMGVSEERVKLAEKKLQVGTGGKPELLQAKVDLNAQRTAILSQQTLIQQLKDQMNGLLGMSLPDEYDVSDTIPINLFLDKEEILTNIENTNQALVAAKKNIEVFEQIVKENRAGRSPVINFVSSYNIINKTENQVEVTPNVTQKLIQNNGFNFGVTASIPILNYMNVNRLINQARINVDRQKIIYDQQLMIAIVGVRNAYVNYDNAKKTLAINEENILLAKENVYIALEGFKRGNYHSARSSYCPAKSCRCLQPPDRCTV